MQKREEVLEEKREELVKEIEREKVVLARHDTAPQTPPSPNTNAPTQQTPTPPTNFLHMTALEGTQAHPVQQQPVVVPAPIHTQTAPTNMYVPPIQPTPYATPALQTHACYDPHIGGYCAVTVPTPAPTPIAQPPLFVTPHQAPVVMSGSVVAPTSLTPMTESMIKMAISNLPEYNSDTDGGLG